MYKELLAAQVITSSSSLFKQPAKQAYRCWTLGSFLTAFCGSTKTLSHTACKNEFNHSTIDAPTVIVL